MATIEKPKLVMNYEREEEVREDRTMYSDRTLCSAVAAVIVRMAPGRRARKLETIMNKFIDALHKNMYTKDEGNNWYRSFTDNELRLFIVETLKGIPEFMELNLSQIEYEKGIEVDDPDRPPFAVTTAYDVGTATSLLHDFVDIDACIRNIFAMILSMNSEDDDDCFLCDYAGVANCTQCDTCSRNSKFKDNYNHTQIPRGGRRTVCKQTCDLGYYICCAECDKTDCTVRCKRSASDDYVKCPNIKIYSSVPSDN